LLGQAQDEAKVDSIRATLQEKARGGKVTVCDNRPDFTCHNSIAQNFNI
jgi:hypothetical protein